MKKLIVVITLPITEGDANPVGLDLQEMAQETDQSVLDAVAYEVTGVKGATLRLVADPPNDCPTCGQPCHLV